MSQQPAPGAGGTFARVQWIPFLAAGGIVVGGVALLERFRPELALPAAAAILLGVGLTWTDHSGTTAATRFGEVLQSSLARLQQGAGLTSATPTPFTGSTSSSSPGGGGNSPSITNPLPGLNLASIFPGGFRVTTPYLYGQRPGEAYNFNGQTVHQGVDIIPQGLRNAAQAIGQNIANPQGGTFIAAIPGSAEQRGIVLRLANGLYEHLYHLDPRHFTPGQYVPAGTILGTIASMAGPHVHYEIRSTATIGGQSYNPLPYLGGP